MEDTCRYRGRLVSDSFLKRAFAVFGSSIVARLIVMLVLGLLVIVPAVTAAAVVGMGS